MGDLRDSGLRTKTFTKIHEETQRKREGLRAVSRGFVDVFLGRRCANTLAGCAFWLSDVGSETRLYYGDCDHVRPGHWREHSHLQRDQRRVVAAAALSRTREAGHGMGE